jgi:hypothetical protein
MVTWDSAGESLRLAAHYRDMTDGELLDLARQKSSLTEAAQQILQQELSSRRLQVGDVLPPEPAPPPDTPETFNDPGQYLRLSEHYRQMTDGELLDLAGQKFSLTRTAQQILQQELSSPRLQIGEVLPPESAAPQDNLEDDDPYAEERRLVEIRTVYSSRDALQLQRILDVAGIPFYIGPEKATGVADVTSDFTKGLPVRIMSVGWPYAYGPLQSYLPKDEPPEEKIEIPTNSAMRCPRCRSTEVIFKRLVRQPLSPGNDTPPPKFEWTCTDCGKEWQDDGVETVG